MEGNYVGIMSGTSMDGVDTALVSLVSNRVEIQRTRYDPYPDALQVELQNLLASPVRDSALAKKIDHELAMVYVQSVQRLIEGINSSSIKAIGCHGQTLLHCPDAVPPFSWQAGDSTILANQTGIPVVSNFREADMQAGGQGAPLAPRFHQYAFSSNSESLAIVNIGGIANVTCLPSDKTESVIGFDTGPGNVLSDAWTKLHRGHKYDEGGQWALSCEPDERLLKKLMSAPYFSLPVPKSLDIRQFSVEWLQAQIESLGKAIDPSKIQSSIAAFTAESILHGIRNQLPEVQAIYVCGGGAKNQAIMKHLRLRSRVKLSDTSELGIDPDWVEACAFALLAGLRMNNQPGNLPSVTGAKKPVILGTVTQPAS